jgi:hypothetical protein
MAMASPLVGQAIGRVLLLLGAANAASQKIVFVV